MTEHPTYIRALLLHGFRAYLEPKAFDFGSKRCIAVFAPNGHGKSSLVDGLEFAFSDAGTLKRLGIRTINNSAGVAALAHNLADDRSIAPSVTLDFRCGSTITSGSRSAIGSKRERPEAISAVQRLLMVDPIIRGYELRRFVEAETAEERYASVANWLQMGPLVEAQKNLRALRQQVKSAAEDLSAFTRINQQLVKETGQAVPEWQPEAVIAYINDAVLGPLDKTLRSVAIGPDDPAYLTIVARAQTEGQRLGLDGLRQVRNALIVLIASEFAEFQLIVTTHDEQFYRFLKDQQAAANWHFVRITKLDRDYGPRFADERVSDAMITDRWNAGESAANEMRKAEEEWLLAVCREFGVTVRIRPLERAFSYDRGELASALAAFLSNAKIAPPTVPGVNNRFLNSIQQGVVENFGSHFQDAPYAYGSLGDEKARWSEFVAFRDEFACPGCGRKKFKRPHDLKKPVCAHEACETQFAF